jgi:glycosyltransferase involved in cell wall biosynthesis
MNEPPFFSIVLPTYNRASTIFKAIESVLGQSYPQWELIVVDDGSSDETRNIVESYNDRRIRYFWKTNEERSIARNFGIDNSQGVFVSFLDSDDFILDCHLSTARECIRTNPDFGVFHLGFALLDNESGVVVPRDALKEDAILNSLLRENSLSSNGMFIRRDLLAEVRFPYSRDAVISEDWCLWLRLIARNSIKVSDRVTSYIVSHSNRSTSVIDPEVYQKASVLLLDVLNKDIEFQRLVGQSKYRWFCAYMNLGVGQNYLINKKINKLIAMKYILHAVKTDCRVLFERRFFVCLKKIIFPAKG